MCDNYYVLVDLAINHVFYLSHSLSNSDGIITSYSISFHFFGTAPRCEPVGHIVLIQLIFFYDSINYSWATCVTVMKCLCGRSQKSHVF